MWWSSLLIKIIMLWWDAGDLHFYIFSYFIEIGTWTVDESSVKWYNQHHNRFYILLFQFTHDQIDY